MDIPNVDFEFWNQDRAFTFRYIVEIGGKELPFKVLFFAFKGLPTDAINVWFSLS